MMQIIFMGKGRAKYTIHITIELLTLTLTLYDEVNYATNKAQYVPLHIPTVYYKPLH